MLLASYSFDTAAEAQKVGNMVNHDSHLDACAFYESGFATATMRSARLDAVEFAGIPRRWSGLRRVHMLGNASLVLFCCVLTEQLIC